MLTNNKKTENTANNFPQKYMRTLPLIAWLHVGVSLPSVGGAAALCYTSTTTVRFSPTAITLTAAAMVWRPATFCHSSSLHTLVLQSAILLHRSHHMIGLPSALFAKLIAAIKVESGDVIQFNSVLMPCLKALSMCNNFRGVCHRLRKYRRRDNAPLGCLHC